MRRVLVEDRTVTAELERDGFRRRALHRDGLGHDLQRLPRALPLHFARVRRVELLDEHVGFVGAGGRAAPCDLAVVTANDSGQSRLGGADRRSIPAREGGRDIAMPAASPADADRPP